MIRRLTISFVKHIQYRPNNTYNYIHKKSLYLFQYSTHKDDQDQIISLTPQEIKKMKDILSNNQNILNQENQGEQFFQTQEAKLSFKLLQIDLIDQLKPIILEYSNKSQQNITDSQQRQILDCKFLVLYKYVNLGGSLQSSQIKTLYQQILISIQKLDEKVLILLLRMIINNPQSIKQLTNLHKNPIIIKNPSHTSSQLISLLLMIYPSQKQQLYKHYYLINKKKEDNYREGIIQTEKQIAYDPINLVHLIQQYFYYQDMHKILDNTMRIKSIQQFDGFLQDSIKIEQTFQQRKIEAIIYSIDKNLTTIYQKYLKSQYFDLDKFDIKTSINLLKAIILIQKVNEQSLIVLQNCTQILVCNIINKDNALVIDQEQQLNINLQYQQIGDIISSYIRKKSNLISKESIIKLMKCIFEQNPVWRIKFNLYLPQQLFSLIVSYKASKDYLKRQNIDIFDKNNTIFTNMIYSYNNLINQNQSDAKQIYFVCLFSYQLNTLKLLKNKLIIQKLLLLSKKKDISQSAKQKIKQIIYQLQK